MGFFLRYNGIVIHRLIRNVDKDLMTPFDLILFALPSLVSQPQPTPLHLLYLFVSLNQFVKLSFKAIFFIENWTIEQLSFISQCNQPSEHWYAVSVESPDRHYLMTHVECWISTNNVSLDQPSVSGCSMLIIPTDQPAPSSSQWLNTTFLCQLEKVFESTIIIVTSNMKIITINPTFLCFRYGNKDAAAKTFYQMHLHVAVMLLSSFLNKHTSSCWVFLV